MVSTLSTRNVSQSFEINKFDENESNADPFLNESYVKLNENLSPLQGLKKNPRSIGLTKV